MIMSLGAPNFDFSARHALSAGGIQAEESPAEAAPVGA
jgi:hypothetical protein